MIACPTCQRDVDEQTWFCPFCAHQLQSEEQIAAATATTTRAPAIEDAFGPLDPGTIDEVSNTTAWKRAPEMLRGEALIVGELSGDFGPIEPSLTFEGVAPTDGGSTQGLLLYADRSSGRLLSPGAVPRLTGAVQGHLLTPYEHYLVSYINGRRNMRELQESGLLAGDEMSVSILTLIERGLVTLTAARSGHELVDATELVDVPADLIADLALPTPRKPAGPVSDIQIEIEEPEPSKPLALDPSLLLEVEPAPKPPAAPPPRARPTLMRSTAPAPAKAEPEPEAPRAQVAQAARPGQEGKAAELYAAALKDRAAGNLVSARMNLKLAIAFDPGQRDYQKLFQELLSAPDKVELGPRPFHAAAAKLFDEAQKAEANNELDRAIRLLERALSTSKEAVIMNRLGVILATRKHQFSKAQELLEAAVEIDPKNAAYTHNLGKVLTAAALAAGARAPASKQGGISARLSTFWDRLKKKPS